MELPFKFIKCFLLFIPSISACFIMTCYVLILIYYGAINIWKQTCCLKMSEVQTENINIAFSEQFHFHISGKMCMMLNCPQCCIKHYISEFAITFLLIFDNQFLSCLLGERKNPLCFIGLLGESVVNKPSHVNWND